VLLGFSFFFFFFFFCARLPPRSTVPDARCRPTSSPAVVRWSYPTSLVAGGESGGAGSTRGVHVNNRDLCLRTSRARIVI
jgi:hypothetical protein